MRIYIGPFVWKEANGGQAPSQQNWEKIYIKNNTTINILILPWWPIQKYNNDVNQMMKFKRPINIRMSKFAHVRFHATLLSFFFQQMSASICIRTYIQNYESIKTIQLSWIQMWVDKYASHAQLNFKYDLRDVRN